MTKQEAELNELKEYVARLEKQKKSLCNHVYELKNRTCEGCKYYKETSEVHKNSCGNIMGITLRPISGLPRDFNCKYWEKKDEFINNG